MMLRLALVGIVVALGVTVPNQSECDSWLVSTENWARSFLANWDRWSPPENLAASEHAGSADDGCEQCRLARLELLLREQSIARATVSGGNAELAARSVAGEEGLRTEGVKSDQKTPGSGLERRWRRIDKAQDVRVTMDFDLIDYAGWSDFSEYPAPLGATQSRLEWASVAERVASEPNASAWQAFSALVIDPATRAATQMSSADDSGSDTLRWPLDDLDGLLASATTAESKPITVDELPAADPGRFEVRLTTYGTDLFETVADQFEGWAANRDIPPAEGPAVGTITEERSNEPAAPSASVPAAITLPAAAAVETLSAPAVTTSAHDLPWPVFAAAAPESDATSAVAHNDNLPWPVFAPADAGQATELAVASEPALPASAGDTPARPTQFPNACEVAAAVRGPIDGHWSSTDAESEPNSRSITSQPSLARAVELTGEAMRAWLGVLARPSRVEMTSR